MKTEDSENLKLYEPATLRTSGKDVSYGTKEHSTQSPDESTDKPHVKPSKEHPSEPSEDPPSKPSKEHPSEPSKDTPNKPSKDPYGEPSKDPPNKPSKEPSGEPSKDPSKPSKEPNKPSKDPHNKPSKEPSGEPSKDPSEPSKEPNKPSKDPHNKPSKEPSGGPSKEPSKPSKEPGKPSKDPANKPSKEPSGEPLKEPNKPSQEPAESQKEKPKPPITDTPAVAPPAASVTTGTVTEDEEKNKCSNKGTTCGQCGDFLISVAGQRVINGADASPGEFPYQVRVLVTFKGDRYTCGGSIIHARWVLSAAHCFIWNVDGKQVRASEVVVAGGSVHAAKLTKLPVDKVITHPDFKDVHMGDDVALIKLSEEIDFASKRHLQPICLGEERGAPLADKAVATGWGRLIPKAEDVYPVKLQEVSLELIPASKCSGVSLPKDISKVLCAMTPHKDTCQGDSGGPLVAQMRDGRWTQVGITSYGFGCACPNNPGVYVRVAHYLPWIEDTTGVCACQHQ